MLHTARDTLTQCLCRYGAWCGRCITVVCFLSGARSGCTCHTVGCQVLLRSALPSPRASDWHSLPSCHVCSNFLWTSRIRGSRVTDLDMCAVSIAHVQSVLEVRSIRPSFALMGTILAVQIFCPFELVGTAKVVHLSSGLGMNHSSHPPLYPRVTSSSSTRFRGVPRILLKNIGSVPF